MPKVLMVWPETGRNLEASDGAFERVYQPQGWKLADEQPDDAPDPAPAKPAAKKTKPKKASST